ncbi:hypothetical protein QUB28_09780 [Microcoleus sp. B4-C3]|uniref:hypothetical protein n=1 Tax=unclassified Microcoleus TaxID=2642155 RepID=UPI002FCF4153
MPVPQEINFLASQAVQPVHKRLIENGATYEIYPTFFVKANFCENAFFGRLYKIG